MTIAEELARLEQLRNNGSLTEIEFEEAKRRALNEQPSFQSPPIGAPSDRALHGMDEKTYCTLMHLSQLLTFSGLGIIAPIVMWVLSKDQSDVTRRHGAAMMNWLISSLIYGVVAGVLVMVFVGFFLLLVLAVLQLVFPIIAALKAKDGIVWSYPLAIKFFNET